MLQGRALQPVVLRPHLAPSRIWRAHTAGARRNLSRCPRTIGGNSEAVLTFTAEQLQLGWEAQQQRGHSSESAEGRPAHATQQQSGAAATAAVDAAAGAANAAATAPHAAARAAATRTPATQQQQQEHQAVTEGVKKRRVAMHIGYIGTKYSGASAPAAPPTQTAPCSAPACSLHAS